MAISFVAATAKFGGGPQSITKPTGTANADVLLLEIASSTNPVPPSGFTQLGTVADISGIVKASLFYKVAGASEPASYSYSTGNDGAAALSAWRGVNTSAPIHDWDTAGAVAASVTVSVDAPAGTAQAWMGYTRANTSFTPPTGMTEVLDQNASPDLGTVAVARGEGISSAAGVSAAGSFASFAALVSLAAANTPPNAPILTTLTGGEVIDRAAANRASHSFSDPDAGDSQSAFDHRYRLVGSATWTTGYAPTPNQYVDYPAGTFAPGDYERQVLTYDSQGVAGPWSPSGFFTAADGPAEPTITNPIQNETIAAETRDITWSAPSQDAYQLQVLDGGLVEYDTGIVGSTSRTAFAVPYSTNNVTRTTRVRVRYGGLWSDWYAITNPVSYTRPPTPSFTLTTSGTGLLVQVTNPAPGAGEPAVVQNDVYVTEDGREERRAIVVPNGSWTYRLPRSGQHYDQLIRIEAIGDNGTRSSS